jgi:hypothetical protein
MRREFRHEQLFNVICLTQNSNRASVTPFQHRENTNMIKPRLVSRAVKQGPDVPSSVGIALRLLPRRYLY